MPGTAGEHELGMIIEGALERDDDVLHILPRDPTTLRRVLAPAALSR